MIIHLNGTPVDSASRNLKDLVAEKRLDPSSLIVELNREIVPQDDWEDTRINDGDLIELLNFVGGG